ncbi:preprotein translocase subunit SecG [Thiohalospira halophila DSM 15071]|jgi:preprotein translocase subunit SecG|uniref:Protein-export membrane protein SecG n=1 Tax=Thiohalospira halophila DSM 15071 TaxID=1123397 RepID=A0A1I1VRT0_9GAMM|nr:preprotein translocase subunit SecG [Thiohalospira halophila]SFD85621.1 preprotein translocase subunit SecG [Thiohalospira halophila DSM 15071]
MLYTILITVHVLATGGLIALVLMQTGKGAEAGAAFGSGASATVFGAQGSASFLTRGTAALATIFFITSLSLAYLSTQEVSRKSVTDEVDPVQQVPAGEQERPRPDEGASDVPTPTE